MIPDKPLPPPHPVPEIESEFLKDKKVEEYLNSSAPFTTEKFKIAMLFRIAKALENQQRSRLEFL
jgi:hypothetical protein